MSGKAKSIFLATMTLTGLIAACLGLETQANNHFGWVLFLVGVGMCAAGVIYLGLLRDRAVKGRSSSDRSLWPIAVSILFVALVPPLEYRFLTPILPRTDLMQDAGLILFSAGLPFYLWSRFLLFEWETKGQPDNENARLRPARFFRLVRIPVYASLFLIGLGPSLGYSSLLGLLAVLILLLPGLIHRMKVENRRMGRSTPASLV